MRRGVELLREQNVLAFVGLLKIALAEAEARAGDADRAIAILDEALATCDRTGGRTFEAELHRTRGETLLKRDPASPAPAEEAFQTAIAVARQQATRSFELRAALSLAKLYQSTGRPVDAHAVLAPALEGFPALSLLPSGRKPAPSAARGAGDEGLAGQDEGSVALTPDPSPERERGMAAAEMPELVEAEALLTALADNEEVKADAARRQRLTQLNIAYGNALFAARGPGAPETTEAFARVRESALWREGYARAIGGRLRAVGRQLAAGRSPVDAGSRRGLPQRRRGETRFAGGRRRPPRRRAHLLVRRRVSRGAGSSGTCARLVPTRSRRRSGLSLRA